MIDLKRINKTSHYTSEIFKKISVNPALKLCLLPALMFLLLEGYLKSCVPFLVDDIEAELNSSTINYGIRKWLVIRFFCITTAQYTAAFMSKAIFSYFLQIGIGHALKAYIDEYMKIEHKSFHDMGSGKIHALVLRRSLALQRFLQVLFTSLLADVIYIIFVMKAMIITLTTPVLALYIVKLVVYAFFVIKSTSIRAYLRRKYNDAYNCVANKTYDILQNHDLIKAYNKEEAESVLLGNTLSSQVSLGIQYDQFTALMECVQKIILVWPAGLVVYGVLYNHFVGNLTYRDFSLYNKFGNSFRATVGNLRDSLFWISQHAVDVIDSGIDNARLDDNLSCFDLEECRLSIQFTNFSLCNGNGVLFRHANICVKAGEKVAIVGKNGTGKSSLINALLGFIDFDGDIYIDGINTRSVSRSSLRNLISYVPQIPYISNTTIINNLQYGQKKLDSDYVYQKCKEYNTHELFSSFENGYLTECGESGKFLSGGQKQKLSFMRAVIKDAPIFILDEPTANLDKLSEDELVDNISRLNKTVFVIVHNYKLLDNFDKIIGISNKELQQYSSYKEFSINKANY